LVSLYHKPGVIISIISGVPFVSQYGIHGAVSLGSPRTGFSPSYDN